MDFSKRIEKEAKKYGVAAQSLILADLMSTGYTEAEAYSIAYAENAVLSFQQNQSIREGITKSGRFKEMLSDRIENLRTRLPMSEGEDMELMSTEEAAKQVLKAAQALPKGSKERGEMFVKYTELLRKNTTVEAEPEEDNIRIYLPLKCMTAHCFKNITRNKKRLKMLKRSLIVKGNSTDYDTV